MTPGNLKNTFGCRALAESGCKLEFDFHKFMKILSKVRVVVRARVSCPLLYVMLGIYRVIWDGKEKEKRFDLECAFIFFQIKSNFGKNLIFSSM